MLELVCKRQPGLPQANENRLVQGIVRLAGAPEAARRFGGYCRGIHGRTIRSIVYRTMNGSAVRFPVFSVGVNDFQAQHVGRTSI
jgi:hypothetical protein